MLGALRRNCHHHPGHSGACHSCILAIQRRTFTSWIPREVLTICPGVRTCAGLGTAAPTGRTLPAGELAFSPLQAFLQNGARMTNGAHSAWAHFVDPGDTVIDATCGNGNDTLYLAKLVGPKGRVYAFDIQEDAIRSARYIVNKGLPSSEMPEVLYFQHCHSTLQEHAGSTGPVKLVCFNLGYFPGGRDRALITKPDTTVAGIKAAMQLLQRAGVTTLFGLCPQDGGLISILGYVAHPGGQQEFAAVQDLASSLPSHDWAVSMHNVINRIQAPVLILMYKLSSRSRQPH